MRNSFVEIANNAGACFSPDGVVLLVNVFSPTGTLEITGAWDRFVS